eukprot:324257-Chlamydomonas_euryale.AAC.4
MVRLHALGCMDAAGACSDAGGGAWRMNDACRCSWGMERYVCGSMWSFCVSTWCMERFVCQRLEHAK